MTNNRSIVYNYLLAEGKRTTMINDFKWMRKFAPKPSIALEGMLKGLEDHWHHGFDVDMDHFIGYDSERNVCVGCAATAAICNLLEIDLENEKGGIGDRIFDVEYELAKHVWEQDKGDDESFPDDWDLPDDTHQLDDDSRIGLYCDKIERLEEVPLSEYIYLENDIENFETAIDEARLGNMDMLLSYYGLDKDTQNEHKIISRLPDLKGFTSFDKFSTYESDCGRAFERVREYIKHLQSKGF